MKRRTSDWREIGRTTVPIADGWNHSDPRVVVIHEVADLTTPDGFEHREGAHRVRALTIVDMKSYKRAKTFYGEFAWADAGRLYGDIVNDVQYGRTTT